MKVSEWLNEMATTRENKTHMKLAELSNINRRTLLGMYTTQAASRQHLAKETGLTPQQVSGGLSRLECLGLVSSPEEPGQGWTITAAGRALFDAQQEPDDPPAPETEPAMEPAPEPESAMEPAPEPESAMELSISDPIYADLIEAMDVDLALYQVRTRLGFAPIPTRSARVYREIVAVLPGPLVKVLEPITELIDACT